MMRVKVVKKKEEIGDDEDDGDAALVCVCGVMT